MGYSKADCIYAIYMVCEELEEEIDQELYERVRDMFREWDLYVSVLPDIGTIYNKCGSFEQAMKEVALLDVRNVDISSMK